MEEMVDQQIKLKLAALMEREVEEVEVEISILELVAMEVLVL
jgi:hypothetical protein